MVYVGHSKNFDFRKELYDPIKNSSLAQLYSFVFPHEDPAQFIDSHNWIKKCDIFLAEVSYPSTGLGIELGWANADSKKIIAIHQKDQKPTIALRAITNTIVSYRDSVDLIEKMTQLLVD